MIELGTIRIEDKRSLAEACVKIRNSALALGLSTFNATKLAVLSSEIGRGVRRNSGACEIQAALEEGDSTARFRLEFIVKEVAKISDAIDFTEVRGIELEVVLEHEKGRISLFLEIPRGEANAEAIEKAREALSARSKDELHRELEETYGKLNSSQKMIQLEKMSAVGQLAADVAHELNNPMMGILNYVQYCLKHTTPDDRRHPVLKDAEKEAIRCSRLIKNMLAFSRLEDCDPEQFRKEDCVSIIEEVLKLLAYKMDKEQIAVMRRFDARIPQVRMNANLIKQVLINIINNAVDALKGRPEKNLAIEVRKRETTVLVSVKDSGIGILPEYLGKIFDPFFTTKPVGQGTGLGLSISLNIIRSHRGEITCASEAGVGTTFNIEFPLN